MNYQSVNLVCANGHDCITTAEHPAGEKPTLAHIDPDIIEEGCGNCSQPWVTVQTLAEITNPLAILAIITSELENQNRDRLIAPTELIYEKLTAKLPVEYHLLVAQTIAEALI